MTIPAADLRFEHALKTLERQIAEATHFWFAAAAMNEVARTNPQTEAAINLTPAFWITARLALEQQAIVAVGKIFGPGEATTKNINSFLRVLNEIRQPVFSKDALAARKRRMSKNADEWLSAFMRFARVLTTGDMKRLSRLVKKHRRTYEAQYAKVRNEHIAHTEIDNPNVRWVMFQKTRIRDLEKLIAFLNQFQEAMWGIYYDGRSPVMRRMRSSVRGMVAQKIEKLRRSVTQEYILAETRRRLALVTEAATARAEQRRLTGA